MVFWGEGMVTMVLWEKGRADYGILGRREEVTMVLWGEGKTWYFGEKVRRDYGTLGEGKG